MASPIGIERIVLVVLDGLRADAVERFELEHWRRLAARGASTLRATTVAPSITAAAMGSLLTGVAPATHGLLTDRFHIPRSAGPIHPVPRCLRDAGVPTTTFIHCIPYVFRGIAGRMTRMLGVAEPHFVGSTARDLVDAARRCLEERRRGLVLLHLPDADRAGHVEGWMSEPYGMAVKRLDEALGRIAAYARVDDDPATLLIALADHGGGGADARDHDSDHVHDRTIPLLIGGPAARPSSIREASLLDVPPTLLWSFGVPVPPSYEGTPLADALTQLPLAA